VNKIAERIEREAGMPGLVSILADRLAPTDLQSILLEVYRLRSRQMQPSTVLSHYQTNRFVRPSAASPTQLLRWEQVAFSPLNVSVTNFDQNAREEFLQTQLLSPVRSEFENVDCAIDDQRTSGRGYYLDLCFHVHATATSGQRLELVDGGCVNWTQKYLSNARERLVISGLGTERLCQALQPDALPSSA